MKKTVGAQASELRALKRMKDSEIDTSDIPVKTDWSNAKTGLFFRPKVGPRTPTTTSSSTELSRPGASTSTGSSAVRPLLVIRLDESEEFAA